MADTYRNFAELHAAEGEGAYNIVDLPRGTHIAVIAPHGGGIEPGTSELARSIAGSELTTYLFEGRKPRGNKTLHITSSSFDEPKGRQTVATANVVVALHGECNKQDSIAYLGGRDEVLAATIRTHLEAAGFSVQKHASRDLQGVSPENICNRGRSGAGVQLELTEALRAEFFASLDGKGRTSSSRGFMNSSTQYAVRLHFQFRRRLSSAEVPFLRSCHETGQGALRHTV